MKSSRRTLVKSAAWATPVVLAGTAVPAYAASSVNPPIDVCKPVASWWEFGADQETGELANPSTFAVGDVVVTLKNSGATNQKGNFHANNGADAAAHNSPGAYPNSLRLRSERTGSNMESLAPQYITLTFSKPVENLSFEIADIDRHSKVDPNDPESAGFRDQIFIPAGSPMPEAVVLGSHLEGDGTEATPWETKFVANDPAYQENQGPSSNYNLRLTWVSPVTEITFAYRQGVKVLDAFPTVWVRPVTFSVTDCK